MSFILMIDDNDDQRELFVLAAQTLRMAGDVVTLASGPLALAHLSSREDRPCLILVDVKMPGMDGPETVRQLRALPGFDLLPMIMLSTSDDITDLRRSRRAGADSYVRKPSENRSWPELLAQLIAYWRGCDAHWSVCAGDAAL